MSDETRNMAVDPNLYVRLSVLAEKRGVPVEELASLVLTDFVAEEEHAIIEHGDLEHRWKTYLENGETVPADQVREKLRAYAAEASRRMEM